MIICQLLGSEGKWDIKRKAGNGAGGGGYEVGGQTVSQIMSDTLYLVRGNLQ